jgi:hypothetical protein
VDALAARPAAALRTWRNSAAFARKLRADQ